jgi:replicative DNA helicase
MKLTAPVFVLKHQAKALSRTENIPLYQELNRVANGEGFSAWSLLSAKLKSERPTAALLGQLYPGHLVLLAARPKQGKTLLGLTLAAQTIRQGNHAAFFTLEFTWSDVSNCFKVLGEDIGEFGDRFLFDGSDDICADYIIVKLASALPNTFVVVDYLQLLDQKRENSDLSYQVQQLRQFARERQLIILCLSQIDRRYDPSERPVPGMADVRLPNPLDLGLFDRTCFLNQGKMHMESLP